MEPLVLELVVVVGGLLAVVEAWHQVVSAPWASRACPVRRREPAHKPHEGSVAPPEGEG